MGELNPWVSPHCRAACASFKRTHVFGAGRNVDLVSRVSQINFPKGKNSPELDGLCILNEFTFLNELSRGAEM